MGKKHVHTSSQWVYLVSNYWDMTTETHTNLKDSVSGAIVTSLAIN